MKIEKKYYHSRGGGVRATCGGTFLRLSLQVGKVYQMKSPHKNQELLELQPPVRPLPRNLGPLLRQVNQPEREKEIERAIEMSTKMIQYRTVLSLDIDKRKIMSENSDFNGNINGYEILESEKF